MHARAHVRVLIYSINFVKSAEESNFPKDEGRSQTQQKKRQPTKREKISANYISGKWLIFSSVQFSLLVMSDSL